MCLAAGNLSGESDVFNEYLITVYQSYRFSSVLLFGVVILLTYTVLSPAQVYFVFGAIVLDYLLFIPCYKASFNIYKAKYVNFIFDFVPLCAGNFTSSDYCEIFHRS